MAAICGLHATAFDGTKRLGILLDVGKGNRVTISCGFSYLAIGVPPELNLTFRVPGRFGGVGCFKCSYRSLSSFRRRTILGINRADISSVHYGCVGPRRDRVECSAC